MATMVLKNVNPITNHSNFTISTFTLTDEFGDFSNISNVKYIWMPQHPDIYKGNILCHFLLKMIKENLLIYSDLRGFMIFKLKLNSEPELYQGLGNSWARLAVDFIDTNLYSLDEGHYIIYPT